MIDTTVRRLFQFAIAVLISTVVIFIVFASIGGDAAAAILGQNATPERLAALRQDLGLDQALWLRYLGWLGDVVVGDFGTSPITQRSVGAEILSRAAVTVPLAMLVMLVTITLSLVFGITAALRDRAMLGTTVSVVTQVAVSIPTFWLGMLAAIYFGVRLGWFPVTGFTPWSESPVEAMRSLALPVLSIAVVQTAILTRYVRSSVLETLDQPFMLTARSRGLTHGQALRRHGLRNALIPIITVIGVQFSVLLGGAIVIENVFALPGMGRLLLSGVQRRDFLVVQGTTLVVVVIVLAISVAVDLLYVAVDPRIRKGNT